MLSLGFGILFLVAGLWVVFGTVVYSLKEQDNGGFWFLLLSLPMFFLSIALISAGWKRINQSSNS